MICKAIETDGYRIVDLIATVIIIHNTARTRPLSRTLPPIFHTPPLPLFEHHTKMQEALQQVRDARTVRLHRVQMREV